MRPGYVRDENCINPKAILGTYGFPLLCFQNVRYKNQKFPKNVVDILME